MIRRCNDGLTRHGKRKGRPPKYLTAAQLENPARSKSKPGPKGLSTFEEIFRIADAVESLHGITTPAHIVADQAYPLDDAAVIAKLERKTSKRLFDRLTKRRRPEDATAVEVGKVARQIRCTKAQMTARSKKMPDI